ncbi:pre-mRNA-splicing factor syf1 [Tilletia horrida]|uniref:Pre-mRNA-splicing factor SYF1 n=1 Tax=Tilletia horrida TaxID=155126 RepID=A0AAN6GQW6_9BASI|nr:pre-mRNA-splicing factor syf1 [Tilletia horrida]KAK0562209.1 pre-mRNA-splicing factor syf1 [Tilletia horrida]
MMGANGKQKQKQKQKDEDEDGIPRFPLAWPIPLPTNDDDLVPLADIQLEQDLLLNSSNPRTWNAYIDHILTTNQAFIPPHNIIPDHTLSPAQIQLLGPRFSSSKHCLAYRRIVSIYERSLAVFPYNYALWRDYLLLRSTYVLGQPRGGSASARRRMIQASLKQSLDLGPTLLDRAKGEAEENDWEAGEALDGDLGWEEWRSLAATYERAIRCLPKMPRFWLLYLSIFFHPKCPPQLGRGPHARLTFDRALRVLPPSLHLRIWKPYLRWAEREGTLVGLKVWRRYLAVDPSLTERYVGLLLEDRTAGAGSAEDMDVDDDQDEGGSASASRSARTLEAAKLLLALARAAQQGKYVSPEGKSPIQLLLEWLDLCVQFPEDIGLEPEEEPTDATQRNLDQEVSPLDPHRLPMSLIVRADGLERYPDQAGRLWTGLATYWIKRGELDQAKETFEQGMKEVVTVRDFTQIFDAYAETSENVIGFLMDELAGDEDAEEAGEGEPTRAEREAELDARMADFEALMERRPFLINDVLLRRNPDDVQEWEKRILLHGENDEAVIATYRRALETINPRKATPNLHLLYLNFAKFYEAGGSVGLRRMAALEAETDRLTEGGEDAEMQLDAGEEAVDDDEDDDEGAEPDLDSARQVFERSFKIPYRRVDDLAELWCEFAEFEVRQGNYDAALRVLARATQPPTRRNPKEINYHDDALSPQLRLFKSLKLWSFYADLEEALGSVDSAKRVYDRILELKIANPQIIVNYAAFLEENKYFEDAFKVYERGVEAFTYPVAFELWNVYLSKFVKRYGGAKIERARDLFEQALEGCPSKFAKPLLLMYGQLEEDHGLAKRAMSIYDRATGMVGDEDRFEMYVFYIAKAAANFGLAATRPIYEKAIEVLPNRQTAEMCLRFAALERKLGEIDRARAIYAHASQFCDPRTNAAFWKQWNQFEIETGSEDTFREMLRIKRSVQAQFNTDISYIAASALSAAARNKLGAAQQQQQQQQGNNGTAGESEEEEEDDSGDEDGDDPMAQAEKAALATRREAAGGPAFVTAKRGVDTRAEKAAAALEAAAADGSDAPHPQNGQTNADRIGGDEEDDDLL